jgi:hypothetical protein
MGEFAYPSGLNDENTYSEAKRFVLLVEEV